ncbi:L-aspartate oxidase [Arenibacter antarcticus]|uniref:L-aspartate oxidase n=1 Tax=Arenibacter antarcticus TaxID=2040469 RepID=A0ABW5VFK8_9FLAO|nr:L-aspartate oxidase [Arenibacter sp. H213]MCM4169483.1 L-aspartate oxidase [Arenibacter sp. H213]
MRTTDYLVIGSGVAGLTFAIKMAEKHPDRSIYIVTKQSEDDSNTTHAQGGVAIVMDQEKDSFKKHLMDTLIAGDGCCNASVVEMVVNEGPERLMDLMAWGANFDRDSKGRLDLAREGGHSENRIVHNRDTTGREIETILLNKVRQLANISILNYHFAIDLITQHHLKNTIEEAPACYGAYVMDQKTERIYPIKARATILATGGIGRLYGHTTNPMVATGDGIGMAYRAKARIKEMEFVQFHPTALYEKVQGRLFLISEAVRGFGAYLRDGEGERFMLKFDKRAELASRDIVSRAIDTVLKKNKTSFVYLDCTHLDMSDFKVHFPNIFNECLKRNINVEKDWIPVVPAAHYLCGGIVVDKNGATNLKNLFALGECSRTGLHGANRLASNSLLEALVYAHKCDTYLSENEPQFMEMDQPHWIEVNTHTDKNLGSIILDITERLQELMRRYVGIVRCNEGLLKAKGQLDEIHKEVEALYHGSKLNTQLCELRNMVNVAHLIIEQSLERKENKGGYFNLDYFLHHLEVTAH